MSAAATATTSDQLSTQEKLLFAQAVYKIGAAAWSNVSSLLLAHPVCTARSKDAFSPTGCEALYVDLMTSIGQNVPAPDAMKPQNKIHLRLAQTYYIARLNELKAEIESYENRFTVLMGEINAIKSGTLDETIRDEVKAGLVRRYGKKLLEWLPDEGMVKDAVEKGPVGPGEVDEEKQKQGQLAADETNKDAKSAGIKSPVVETASLSDKPKSTKQDKHKSAAKEKPEKPQEEEDPVNANEGVELARKPVSTRGKPESKKAKSAVPVDVPEDEHLEQPSARPKTPVVQSPTAKSSPPPQADPETPAQASSPPPAETSTRASKRKASAQPRGAPASKRGTRGRRGTSPEPAQSDAPTEHDDAGEDEGKQEDEDGDVDMEAEPEPEPEPEPEETLGRGRRSSKRHSKLDSPPPTSRPKDGSPATSRRAGSVASSASTPQPVEDKRRRGRPPRIMRDDVVSKSVREQSAAVESVKEDEDEAESPAEETRPRTRRGRKGTSPVEERKEKEKDAPVKSRRTRGAKTPIDTTGEEEQGEADSSTAAPNTAESKGGRSDRGSEKPSTRKGPRRSEPKAVQTILFNLLDTIQSHRHGSVFQNPVKKSEAPDYYDVIKRPMDLKKIRQRVKDGEISSIDEFERDLLLLFAWVLLDLGADLRADGRNAMMYNGEDSQVYEMAKKMLHEAESHVAHYRTMQDDLAK